MNGLEIISHGPQSTQCEFYASLFQNEAQHRPELASQLLDFCLSESAASRLYVVVYSRLLEANYSSNIISQMHRVWFIGGIWHLLVGRLRPSNLALLA